MAPGTVICALHLGDYAPTLPLIGTGDDPVAVEMPSLLATQTDGRVDLVWFARTVVGDGYHVYRRDPEGHEDRLTDVPQPPVLGTIRFSDRPDYPQGTVLSYCYAVVCDGGELARSPEVDETVRSGHARVSVFDLTGRLVRTLVDERQGAGEHSVLWQGCDDSGRRVASGTYYLRLETDSGLDHGKITLLK